jgi:hypothetical protein
LKRASKKYIKTAYLIMKRKRSSKNNVLNYAGLKAFDAY